MTRSVIYLSSALDIPSKFYYFVCCFDIWRFDTCIFNCHYHFEIHILYITLSSSVTSLSVALMPVTIYHNMIIDYSLIDATTLKSCLYGESTTYPVTLNTPAITLSSWISSHFVTFHLSCSSLTIWSVFVTYSVTTAYTSLKHLWPAPSIDVSASPQQNSDVTFLYHFGIYVP